ncbi:Flp family type IVb pilin [Oxalobacteraceae bacterium OTU3CINTB1]|nr:Flp family type IVb pilin [Oxalobacteraceae bacterium OTU3CINTB1]
MNAIKNFINDEAGVTAIEYALIAAGIAVVAGAAATAMGPALKTKFNAVITALGGTAVP